MRREPARIRATLSKDYIFLINLWPAVHSQIFGFFLRNVSIFSLSVKRIGKFPRTFMTSETYLRLSCWNTLGFAIRMGQSIGLHVDSPPTLQRATRHNGVERELRRRAWYSMYVLDRLLALQLGRPVAIHGPDFDVQLPSRSEKISFCSDCDCDQELSDEGCESLQVSLMDYFRHVIRFSHIVGLVIGELYQPTQIDSSPDKMLLSASSLDTSLSKWKAELPRHLRFDLGHTFEKSITLKRQVCHFVLGSAAE